MKKYATLTYVATALLFNILAWPRIYQYFERQAIDEAADSLQSKVSCIDDHISFGNCSWRSWPVEVDHLTVWSSTIVAWATLLAATIFGGYLLHSYIRPDKP